jgi:hypothetical protein
MDSDKLNQWVSLAANIGVFIGLIFLVVELKQTNDLAEANAYRARGDEIQTALQSVALSSELAEILVKVEGEGFDALSTIEAMQYRQYLWAGVFRMQNQYNDYRLGYLDEYSYQGMLGEATRRYPLWIKLDIPLNDPEFKQAVERALHDGQVE